jgi:hypothetical protein
MKTRYKPAFAALRCGRQNLMAAALVGILGLCATGCQLFNDLKPDYLTSVTITNKPMADVTNTMATVFAAHGFTGGRTGFGEFTYRRPGSQADQIAYGSYMFNETVSVKVQVTVQPMTTNSILLGCNAWLVKAENNPTFAESYKVKSTGKSPYEQLLKDIQTQLGE